MAPPKFDVKVSVNGSLREMMAQRSAQFEEAVTEAVFATGADVKADWRSQVAAKFGTRLGNTITYRGFPRVQASVNAVAEVFSRAPDIIAAHERGALIRANSGVYIAVPTAAAGKGLTPGEWQFKFGRKLIFVPPGGRRQNAMLVLEGGRFRKSGRAAVNRRKRRSDGVQTGETVIPIFILVRQVRLPKRLNLLGQVSSAQAKLAARLQQAMNRRLR